jgi:heavy metal sensor kinase
MSRWQRSLRVSLTLWYVGAMVVVLAVYAGAVFTFVSANLSRALDDRLRGDFQWAAEMAEQRPDGTLSWFEGHDNSIESPWLQVWTESGQRLYRTGVAERNPIPEADSLATRADQRIVSVTTPAATFRVLSGRSRIVGKPVVIQVARTDVLMRQELRDLMLMLVLGIPFGVVAAGLGGYSLARRALAPVERMADRARSITAERLSDRLPIDNPNDELGRLASVFNETLGRLESSFEQMRQFTADVSHELRTPLTAIRSVGEVGLRERRDERSYRAIIGSMLEEVDHLASLVDRLLVLSRAETGQARLSVDVIDVGGLAEEVGAHLGVLAEEKRQALTIEHVGTPRGSGDRFALRQALINLVDNAIKYTPAGGEIHIRVSESPSGATLDVSDTGPGIPAELSTRIFDRFYRAGRSRSEIGGAPGAAAGPQARHPRVGGPPALGCLGGVGLGLSIAKWAVEVSGGQLTLVSTNGTGSTFRITLPRAAGTRPQESRQLAPF